MYFWGCIRHVDIEVMGSKVWCKYWFLRIGWYLIWEYVRVREQVFFECKGYDDGYCFFVTCRLRELFDGYESEYY